MKISTRGRYGLRLLVDICVNGKDAPVPLRAVAHRQNISEKYLEQIIMPLARAGIVRSMRGAAGGYMLRLPPDEITVGQVLRVLEGSLCVVECERDGEQCPRRESCSTVDVWESVTLAIGEVVDNINLAEIACKYVPDERSSFCDVR